MSSKRDAVPILVLVTTVLALFAAPPAVALSGLVGGLFVGIMTFLAVYESELAKAGTAAGQAAAVTTVTTLAVLGLAHWIGPGTVVTVAVVGVMVMVHLGRRVLRQPPQSRANLH